MRAPTINGSKDNTDSLSMTLFAWVVAAVFMFFLALYEGWVLMHLWSWYIVPAFKAPHLEFKYATGLVIVVSSLTVQHIPRSEDEIPGFLKWTIMAPAVLLSLGWVVLQVL